MCVPTQFLELLREVHQYQATVGCPSSRILPLLHNLNAAFTAPSQQSYHTQVLCEQRAWHATTQQFVDRLQGQYPCYRDLVVPYEAGVVYMQAGLQWMAKAVEVVGERAQLFPGKQQVSWGHHRKRKRCSVWNRVRWNHQSIYSVFV